MLHDGWSGQEDWGVWAEGMQSDAQFVATARRPMRLDVSAFPLCVPGKNQRISLEVNGTAVADHEWRDCEPWNATVDIPEALVRVGFNDLTLRPAYADAPAAGDTRRLSAGFSKLRVDAAP